MELYRKVKVSDRLPIKSGLYYTSEGYLYYNVRVNIWDNVDMIFDPEYWFELVVLPTEEEINDAFPLMQARNHSRTLNMGCQQGAQYIINKIKGD